MTRSLSAWQGVRVAVLLCAVVQVLVMPFAPDPSRNSPAYWTLSALCALLISSALIVEIFWWDTLPPYVGPVGVTLAVVGAVACRWGALLAGEPGSLRATVTMAAGVLMVLLFLIFLDYTAVAVVAGIGCIAVGLVLGPKTGLHSWERLAAPPVSLSVFLVVALCTVGLRTLVGEIGLLQQSRSRSDARVGREREASALRRSRLDRINAQVRPLIERMAAGETLDDDDVLQAWLLEGRLRDGIRAPALDSPELMVTVTEARRRGLTVTLLDDGGLEGLAETPRRQTVQAVSAALIGELTGLGGGTVTARILPPGRDHVAVITVHEGEGTRMVEIDHL